MRPSKSSREGTRSVTSVAQRTVLALIGLFVSCLHALDAARASEPRTRVFEYLHVEANSGGSSGGHAAICFDDSCFHFQQTQGTFLRIKQDSASGLDHSYRALENRTVHAYRVEVSEQTFDVLADAFERYHLVQTRQFQVLEALREEKDFLSGLLRTRRAAAERPPTTAPPLRVPGSAYFHPDAPSPAAAPMKAKVRAEALALERLARQLQGQYGQDCLDRRAEVLLREIAALSPLGSVVPPAPPAQDRFDVRWTGFSARHRELLGGLLAVEVLRKRMPLRNERVRTSPRSAFQLNPHDIQILRSHQADLNERLVRLFSSRRPDWGYPMLVGLARLEALETSIESRRLALLDVFREDAEVVPADVVARHRFALTELARERLEDFTAAREKFFGQPTTTEMSWSWLETAGNLMMEFESALAGPTAMRVHHDEPIPAKSAQRSDWLHPSPALEDLEQALAIVDRSERSYREALRDLYQYDLVRRNCVTEIFSTIEKALGRPRAEPLPGSRAQLRGRVRTGGTLNFIPFISARAVAREYGAEVVERPSYRRLALADWSARESPAQVWLRESNVFTSRLYVRNAEDPFFLFFTEESRALRPLLGAANLIAAGGATALGLSVLVVDHGEALRAALGGILFSAPELVAVNLRKGSFPFAPHSWLQCLDTPDRCQRESAAREARD